MASKGTIHNENVGEQKQPVVDRDKVKQEREARRLAKLASKQKLQDKSRNLSIPPSDDVKTVNIQNETSTAQQSIPITIPNASSSILDSNVNVKNIPCKKQTPGKGDSIKENAVSADQITNQIEKMNINRDLKQSNSESMEKPEKKQLSKAERRAIQEQQRAAKAAKTTVKPITQVIKKDSNQMKMGPSRISNSNNTPAIRIKSKPQQTEHRVKLFNHLYVDKSPSTPINSMLIHPAIIRLGVQYSSGVVKGCNARGIAFMNAIKSVISEYETPDQKDFSRDLEDVIKKCGCHLQQCRPLAVSVSNAMKFIQFQLRQLPKSVSDAEQKVKLINSIDTYVQDQMYKAVESISDSVQKKISDGDVILTFGCSSIILNILTEANTKHDFRVVVVDARPWHEGREMLRRLVARNIKCTCILINAVGFIMPTVTKVLLGAHALLANGYVMSRAGTAQIALVAKSYNVPVLVCCETHKFSERVQTDAFVYNEIGNPYDIVKSEENNSPLANWESIPNLTPLNLYYDVTPPELVSAVVTEVAILPCTSVPVILRIKPSEIGY